MNLQSIKKNIQKNGLRGALKKYTKKAAQMTLGIEDHEKKYKILLLTNKDSDNTGDQVIEACDRSLLYMIMKNLGITNYRINSKPATLVRKPYEVADRGAFGSSRKRNQRLRCGGIWRYTGI